ncbi:MAG: DUF882 domain-containing protein [Alphaproteobacteria bacterium]|nr:DUF882 domain-containing protein [Alphaproteobacteria bacterium]
MRLEAPASGSKFDNMDRRKIIKMGLAGMLASVVPSFLSAGSANAATGGAWRVVFRNAHTGESFNGVYRVGDKYLPESFEKLNYVLRDFRTREVFPMDPRVIDLVSVIQKKTGQKQPLDVLSGYRSPKTNAGLRHNTSGVAKNSFHMYGQAIDIRLDGYSTRNLRNIAQGLKGGGVGYYPKSDFIHVDTGSVRTW